MRTIFIALSVYFITALNAAYGQHYVDKVKFFNDTSVVNATLTFNMGKLLSNRDKEGIKYPAIFSCKQGDSLAVNDHIQMQVRGHYRRSLCYMPPIKLIYKDNASAAFYHLKTLKLVSACKPGDTYEQYLLKEFLIYKLYNLITDKSLHVRLLNLSYQDSSGKKKTITRHAFLLEDAKEMAKRNDCADISDLKFATEKTNRRQMALVAIFEYMIGNTDWAVPVDHNIILIRPKKDSTARPFPVAYDFDFSGFVNTDYAFPDDRLGIENVRQRLYRGFPRTMEELNDVLSVFKARKAEIFTTVDNFNLLTPRSKKEITGYLDEFYRTINDPSDVKNVFITNARTN
jgi:hypothetical protein